MLCVRGVVCDVGADYLLLETEQQSSCASCAVKAGCGQGALARWGAQRQRLQVPLAGRAATDYTLGQRVDIGLDEQALVSGALRVYLLPLLGLLVGTCLGQWLGPDLVLGWRLVESLSALLALMGFCISVLALIAWSRRDRSDSRWQPFLLDTKDSDPTSAIVWKE
mgnify:CR=1 FL=1